MTKQGLFASYAFLDAQRTVIIEDDGRVGYAYLLDPHHTITADVWLYNRGPSPQAIRWRSTGLRNFANPAAYAEEVDENDLPRSVLDFKVELDRDDDDTPYFEIFLTEELLAVLTDGARPGWCRYARLDGPVARSLNALKNLT